VPIGEMLVHAKVLTRDQLDEALQVPREPGRKLGQLLIERGWVTEAQLTQTLSLQLSVPWVSLYHIDFSRQLLNRIRRELADRHCLIPIFVRHVKGHGETLYVAMEDPTNEEALAEVAAQATLPARPMIASASDIRSAIRVYYGEVTPPNVIEIAVPAGAHPEPLPMTTREGRIAAPSPPPVPQANAAPPAPAQPPAAASAPPSVVPSTQPDAAPFGARAASQPPPPRASQPPVPPPPPARPRTVPPAGEAEARPPRASTVPPPPASGPVSAPPSTPEGAARRRPGGKGKMVSLTLLDGTTIALPSRPKGGRASAFASQEGLTASDFVSALRAASHGADASEILGEKPQWEPVVAALLSILLRKGLIADWELVDELRKI
jgi:type IV pilus assembly protein PilB